MFPTTSPLNISNTTRYFIPSNDRNPNSAPPTRTNYFPMSSQPSSSSSPTKLSSSAQVRNILSPSNDTFLHNDHAKQEAEAEEEDEDFGGLEEMTNTQWINEVPSSARDRTRSRSRRDSTGIDPELSHIYDLDHNSDNADVYDEGQGQGQARSGDESSRHGSILFPSQYEHYNREQEHVHISSSMRTPAGSYSFSDPTTLGAPITPSTPHHDHSSPASAITWSPSPLSSRSRRKAQVDTIRGKGKGVMVEASDEDDDDNDKENISPNMSSPILLQRSIGKGKEKARRVIQSDDDEDSEDDIPLATRSKGKGKGREVESPVDILDVDLEESEPIRSSTSMTRDNTRNDQYNNHNHNHNDNDDDFDDDIFEDAWANADFDFELAQLEEADAARSATSTTITTSTTFPTFTNGDATASTTARRSSPPTTTTKFIELAPTPQLQNNNTYSYTPRGSILDVITGTDTTSSLVYIKDLEPILQEFYNNHWRRGADKEKAKSNKRQLIGEIDDDEEEEEEREERAVVKKKVPAKRGWAGRGGYGWRGRARGTVKRKR